LGYEFQNATEARKTLQFEITNEAYEYSGLLRRMLQSNRDETTTESTDVPDDGNAVPDNERYFISGVSSEQATAYV